MSGDERFALSFAAWLIPAVAACRPVPSRDRPELRGIQFEPAADGGAIAVATSGCALAVAHDPNGFVRPAVRLHLPDPMVAACRRPAPHRLFCEGEWLARAQPDLVQPDRLCADHAGAMVFAKDPQAPGLLAHAFAPIHKNVLREDEPYRLPFELIDWRRFLPAAPFADAQRVDLGWATLQAWHRVDDALIHEICPAEGSNSADLPPMHGWRLLQSKTSGKPAPLLAVPSYTDRLRLVLMAMAPPPTDAEPRPGWMAAAQGHEAGRA